MTEPFPVSSSEPFAGAMIGSADAPSRQVYIVDDGSMVRRSLSFSLTTSGFATRAFASGRDFLEEVDTLAPGCVLLDIRMPDIDGLALLEQLGERVRRFAIVAITGHGDVDIAVRAMKRGASDFLEKPFTDAALTEVIVALLSELPVQVDAVTTQKDAAARIARLTPREQDVLAGLIAGLPNKTLAHSLGIGVRTVEMHRGNLMARLGAKSLAEVLRIATSASGKYA